MPYTLNNYPDRIKDLPVKAREIWVKAFNSAYQQYNGNEKKVNAVAWAAIEKAGYRKDSKTGEWKRWR
jgi:cation transport regulator ChaB